jgi:hypothetical protein
MAKAPPSPEENFHRWAKKLKLPADTLGKIECLIQNHCMAVACCDARLAETMRQVLFERATMALPSREIVAYVTDTCVELQREFFLNRPAEQWPQPKRVSKQKSIRKKAKRARANRH